MLLVLPVGLGPGLLESVAKSSDTAFGSSDGSSIILTGSILPISEAISANVCLVSFPQDTPTKPATLNDSIPRADAIAAALFCAVRGNIGSPSASPIYTTSASVVFEASVFPTICLDSVVTR